MKVSLLSSMIGMAAASRKGSLLRGVLSAQAATSKLLWVQHEDTAVYTSSGLSRHVGTTPTFATATWLNPPIMVETFNVSDSGLNIWEFDSKLPNADLSTFMVDMSRHAVSFGPAGYVDVVAAQANFVPPSACNVFAFNSLSTSTPIWQWNMSNCDSSLLYDSDRYIDISDDGSTVAFSAFLPEGTKSSPLLTVFDGQTGAVRYSKNLGTTGEGGPVQLSENGAWAAWTQGDSVVVYDGKTGSVRDTISMGWNTAAQLSDSGDFLAFGGDDIAHVYTWSAANSQYTSTYSFKPPANAAGDVWYTVSCSVSSDGTGSAKGELAAFAWISADVKTARVTIYSMVTGALLSDWTSSTNAALQTNPTVRMDGNYAGVCLWGDNDDTPTAVVLSAGSSTPIFTYTTPGSMFGVDIVHDKGASTPTNDVIYFGVGGKHVPANAMGNGGDAFAWRIDQPL